MEDESGELPLKAKLEALPVTTVVEAQAALEEAKAKINGIDSNPDVIRQYEQLGRGKGRTCRDGRHKGGSGQRN